MKRLAILNGLDGVRPGAYGSWDGRLNAAVADAVGLDSLFARGGMEGRMVLDDRATLDNAAGALELAGDDLDDGDAAVWTFSGHGSNDDDGQSFCFYDGELSDTKFHNLLARFRPGVRLVCILDLCFAAGVTTPGVRSMKQRRFKPPGFMAVRRALGRATQEIKCAALMFNACRTTEESAEDARHGYFTGALLDSIRTGATWEAWFEIASTVTTQRNPFQHPVAYQLGPQTIFPAQVFTFDLSPNQPPSGAPVFPTDPGPSR